jgi:hypothetical protein
LNFSFRTPANVTVKLYYRRTGSSTWHYLRSTKTGHDGFYSFTHRPALGIPFPDMAAHPERLPWIHQPNGLGLVSVR